MIRTQLVSVCLGGLLLLAAPPAARAQFFLGAPSSTFSSTSGTVTSTPAIVPNNGTYELDVNGQLIVQNATPLVQTSSFQVSCLLDPTFNSGFPLSMQMQINQNGFVVVPTGGTIYGWTLTADIVNQDGTSANTLTAQWPNTPNPYTAGTTFYGPNQTLGSAFTYNPSATSMMVLNFTSNFDGLPGPNSYTWDFPLSVQLVAVPEPTTLVSACLGLAMIGLACWRKSSRRCK